MFRGRGHPFAESGIHVINGESAAAVVLEGLQVPEHGVGGPGPQVKLDGVTGWPDGSAREHEQIGDAGVGGECLDEFPGPVGRADQAHMKGHRRSTSGRSPRPGSAGCAASAGPRDTKVSPGCGVGVLV